MLNIDIQVCCRGSLSRSEFGATVARLRHSAPQASQRLHRAPRVLVVEFRDEVFAALLAALRDQDCEVQRAESGAAAGAALARFLPDLVLVNESLPDESGWLIACKARFWPRRRPGWFYAARLVPSTSAGRRLAASPA